MGCVFSDRCKIKTIDIMTQSRARRALACWQGTHETDKKLHSSFDIFENSIIINDGLKTTSKYSKYVLVRSPPRLHNPSDHVDYI